MHGQPHPSLRVPRALDPLDVGVFTADQGLAGFLGVKVVVREMLGSGEF